MKSDETSFLLGLYREILSDIRDDIPELEVELSRDWLRLCSLVKEKGMWFLTADLPELGKHFERCLDSSLYSRSGMVASAPYRRGGVIPNLFRGLLLRVFHESGLLRFDYDVLSVRYLRQLYLTAKKYEKECTNERVYRSVDEFFEVERSLRKPSLDWDSDYLDSHCSVFEHVERGDPYLPFAGYDGSESVDRNRTSASEVRDHPASRRSQLSFNENRLPASGQNHTDSPSYSRDLFDSRDSEEKGSSVPEWSWLTTLQETADIISSTLGVFSPQDWRTKHGPGAVSDRRGISKYSFPNWPDKLEAIFPQSEFAHANYGLWVDSLGDRAYGFDRFSKHEPPSKLLAVPKTQKGPRLIASEPISHQWCQQALKDYFDHQIRNTPISSSVSFKDQTPNQCAAYRASRDGGAWTIDLSSASDRMSCWVVERFFRRNVSLLDALHASRTRWVFNSIGGNNPTYHRLRKFSTMGSACTFPVETIVFAGIAVASVLISQGKRATIRSIRAASKEVQVFGDDIVIPNASGTVCLALLADLGFKVNASKTFGTGRFRESCGKDVYSGFDVTPVYVRKMPEQSAPESIDSAVRTHNNMVVAYMPRTATYLKQSIPSRYREGILEVSLGSGTFGYWTRGLPSNRHLRSRVNPDYQVHEYRAFIPIGKTDRVQDEGASTLLQYFTEAPQPHHKWIGGVVSRSTLKLRRRWVGPGQVVSEGTARRVSG